MSFYSYNITVQGPDQEDIAAYCRERGLTSCIYPIADGYTIFSHQEGTEVESITQLAQDVSRVFGCAAMALHDWDEAVLSYWLYQSGQKLDDYNSCPDYFDLDWENIPPRGPMGGNATILCEAFGRPIAVPLVDAILHGKTRQEDGTEYTFSELLESSLGEQFNDFRVRFALACREGGIGEETAQITMKNGIDNERERHAALVAALGMPPFASGFEYDDAADGCISEGYEDRVIWTGLE